MSTAGILSTATRRGAISVSISEVLTALDGATTGTTVFDALVDDNAAVVDHFDAFFGEPIIETASATDTVTTGSIYNVLVVESAAAVAAEDGVAPTHHVGSVVETATATDTEGATLDVSMVETGTAADSLDATVYSVYTSAVVETATAIANVDGTVPEFTGRERSLSGTSVVSFSDDRSGYTRVVAGIGSVTAALSAEVEADTITEVVTAESSEHGGVNEVPG